MSLHRSPLPKVYFVFPNRVLGGCSVLFLRLANYLNANNLAECTIVDFKDGYMSKNAGRIPTLAYGDEDIFFESNSVVVTQAAPPWTRLEKVRYAPEAKLLHWHVHPYNLVPVAPGFRSKSQDFRFSRLLKASILKKYYETARDFAQFLDARRGLIFMDNENREIAERYLAENFRSSPFVPIPVSIGDNEWLGHSRVSSILKVLWVGRIVDFKFYILKHGIQQLNTISSTRITITVVGEGDRLDELRHFCALQGYDNVEFVSGIPHEDLQKRMLDFDIVLAMGTSAIESGSVGVPTILLDPCYSDVENSYSFRWLYESHNFDLGSFTYHESCKTMNADDRRELETLISEYLSDPRSISEQTYTYTSKNHGIVQVAQNFVDAVESTQANVGLAREFMFDRQSILYSLFIQVRKTVRSLERKFRSAGMS